MTRSRCITFFARAAIVPLAALAIAGYGSAVTAAGASTAPQKATKGKSATVRVAKTDLGKILVNSKGRTLYLFRADQGTATACFGECATAWPPLRASGTPKVGKGLNASLVATTPRTEGNPQVTYNGHPLYTFQGDEKAGDTNGQGLNAFGATWWALSRAGNEVTKQPSSTTNGGGGTPGY
jgi:predicted lipoprotein with Yx(FWY)xxD motif